MLIPYADFFNHENVDAEYQIINTSLHTKNDQTMSTYYLKSKMENDYSILVGDKKQSQIPYKRLVIDDGVQEIYINKDINWEVQFLSAKENNIWNM